MVKVQIIADIVAAVSKLVYTIKRLQLRFSRLFGFAVLLGFGIQAADFLHRGRRVKRDFLPVVMHIYRLAVGYHHMTVFIQFQFHVSKLRKKKRHPPQNTPFFQTKGNKNAV